MKTTWKDIQPVPTSQEFLDIVLSRTQRRLPTQIRAGFQISRIRSMCETERAEGECWDCLLICAE
jgi:GTP1/Obg family GTP-binding protein